MALEDLDQTLLIRRELGRAGLRLGTSLEVAAKKGDTRIVAGCARGTPEPGTLAKHVVKPGRPVAFDPPRKDLVFPYRRGRGEPVQLFQNRLDKGRALARCRGMNVLAPEQEVGEDLRSDGQALSPPHRHGYPAHLGQVFSFRPSARFGSMRIAQPNDLPLLAPSFEQIGCFDRRDRITRCQVGQADQSMSTQKPAGNRRASFVVRS